MEDMVGVERAAVEVEVEKVRLHSLKPTIDDIC